MAGLTLMACGGARSSAEPPSTAAPRPFTASAAPSPPSSPLVQAAAEQPPRRSIGKCQVRHEGRALWDVAAPAAPAQLDASANYARFRQRKVIHVGHIHLSIAHFAFDAKTLIAVSESEA
ncbi:MAG TPA: hypothetical protein VI072_35840, partial [Polyangiaceae bacterium]